MLQSGIDLVTQMATTTISFTSDVVTNLWPYFLTIGVIAFSVRFILGKLGFGQR